MRLRNRWWHGLPFSLITSVSELFGSPKETRKKARGKSMRPRLEQLEDRTLMSITLEGVPEWVERGPGPIIDPKGVSPVKIPLQFNPSAGAVEAIAIDPIDPRTIYAGTVNGGIWKHN